MLQTVIEWKSNGNEIKKVKRDLIQFQEYRIYLSEPDAESYVNVYTSYKGIFFYIGRTFAQNLHNYHEDFKIYDSDENVKLKSLSGYPNYVILKVIEESGEDVKPYLERREAVLQQRRDEDKKRQEEREKRDEEYRQEELKRRFDTNKKVIEDLGNNKMVFVDDLLISFEENGLKLPPKTLGSFRKQESMRISMGSVIHYNKRTSKNTLNSYWSYVRLLMKENGVDYPIRKKD